VTVIGTGSKLAIALLAALSMLLAGASSASALRSSSAPIEATASGFEAGKAKCDDGERVISGGFTGSEGDYALVNKAARGNAWVVKGEITIPATVFAYCSPNLKPEQAKATKAFGGKARANATAKCDRGAAAAGGWAYKPLTGNSPVFTSRPSFNRWRIGGFSDVRSGKITSYAYCVRRELEVHQNTSVLPANGDTVTTSSCDDGTELLGGGFETLPEPDFDNLTGPDPFINSEGRDDPLVWAVEAHNYSVVAGSLEAFAICLP